MKRKYAFIRSKVARRVVWLFFISALLPILVLGIFSITYVSDLLIKQSYDQLQHASKLYGMAVLERLLIVDDKLRKLSDDREYVLQTLTTPGYVMPDRHPGTGSSKIIQFDSMAVETVPINHELYKNYDLDGNRKTILFSKKNTNGEMKVYLRRIIGIDNKNNQMVTLLAELNSNFLWGDKETLPFSAFLCVVNEAGNVLFCSQPDYSALLSTLAESSGQTAGGKIAWENRDGENLGVVWDLFTQAKFSGSVWKIITSRAKAEALLPVYVFHRIFPAIILFSILIVLLLSLIQVRRILQPLQRMVVATRQLANYHFDEPVKVNSEDEFRDLADSFNSMAMKLEKQFSQLKILSEIDQLILTYPDLDVVISRIFDTAHKIISCDFIVITLVDSSEPAIGRTYIKEIADNRHSYEEKIIIPETESEKLLAGKSGQLLNLKLQHWHILEPIIKAGVETALVYPILLDGKLRAIFSLGYRNWQVHLDTDADGITGVIDRLAVALATADRDEKLYHQAHFDLLTGLPNRQLFNDRLEQHLLLAHRKHEKTALLYIDLDRFKNINDSLGHASGDKLLRQVAERMMNCVRETDTISRMGGDEFVIVLSNISSAKDAGFVAENIINAISKPYYIYSREIFVNASIGISVYPEDGKDNKELLAHADAAMYHAKMNGRGRYVFF